MPLLVTRNCLSLAILMSELDAFGWEFNRGRHFPNLRHLIIAVRPLNNSEHEQGKLVLEDEVPFATLPLAHQQIIDAMGAPPHRLKSVSVNTARRNDTKLMTNKEKNDRKRVKEGRMRQDEVRVKKIAKMPKREREKVQKEMAEQQRYMDDMALAAE